MLQNFRDYDSVSTRALGLQWLKYEVLASQGAVSSSQWTFGGAS